VKQLREFVEYVEALSGDIGFKVSSRGWGYILEQRGLDRQEPVRQGGGRHQPLPPRGLLPVDFVAEEAARAFSNIEMPTENSPTAHVLGWVEAALKSDELLHSPTGGRARRSTSRWSSRRSTS
jgi:hypothetical protein